jgi:hypothetical protein
VKRLVDCNWTKRPYESLCGLLLTILSLAMSSGRYTSLSYLEI